MTIRRSHGLLGAASLLGLWAAVARAAPPELERQTSESELHGVEINLKASQAEQRRIEADVETLRLDRGRLNQALLDTTARLQKIEADRAAATERLAKAASEARALEASFGARRDSLAQMLAALQRMTHDAPPAILVRPDDMAAAARAAGVVAGLIGDAKAEADALSRDLAKASDLKRQIASEREDLAKSAEQLAIDKARLDALIAARQQALSDRETALGQERHRADDLAAQATGLRDLIGKMEGDDQADREAASVVANRAANPAGDLARLSPATPFADLKARLPWPVPGTVTKNFGDPDGLGGQVQGVSMTTAPGATVANPADAWVAYAGPYRSYGQLLILNAGEGYYMVLAGMERIQVSVGQFVLAGEPVAVMGSGGARAAGTVPVGAGQPVLYIEFRKNDTVIDPQPWWSKSNLEKARG